MKLKIIIAILANVVLASCGSGEKKELIKTKTVKKAAVKKTIETKEIKKEKTVTTIDMNNKGVEQIKYVILGSSIDKSMADKGQQLFKNKCSTCHRSDREFIGPSPTGIMDRRSPAWIMMMVMNPSEMTAKDPIAKELLAQFNGSPMADQNKI